MANFDYDIVKGGVTMLDTMKEKIQRMIADGWEPNGELVVAKLDNQSVFVQGMIRYNEPQCCGSCDEGCQ